MPHRSAALIALVVAALLLGAPAAADAQSYTIPPDNPFVGTSGARGEIYLLGMRNPYRWSFDSLTGDMYVGDVGGAREEVTLVPRARQAGANLGWNCFSGTVPEPEGDGCDPADDVGPAFEYPSGPDVVIGGYVIRDPALPGFAGQYIYGRFTSGVHLRTALGPGPDTTLFPGLESITGFGEDGAGHLHVTSLDGPVRRIVQTGNTLALQPVGDFDQPVAVAAPPGDPDRLFVVEKPGRIMDRDGSVFLDLTSLVTDGGEQGLLALAVAPDYATSGRVFAFYTDNAGDLQLDEFRRTGVGPDSSQLSTRRPILTIPHGQASNHNGGQLLFGPDGMLYLSTGDGGTQGDPEDDAQSLGSLLGKILRIDVGYGRPGAPPIAPADTVPPVLTARVKRRQRVLRLRGAVAYARCSEACTVRARGVLRIGKRRYRMRAATRSLQVRASGERTRQTAGIAQATGRVRIKVVLPRKGRRALRRAHRRGRRPIVRLALRATDTAGNRSRLVRRGVRAVRRPPGARRAPRAVR